LTGVTIVQLRDKTSDKALHAITKPANIPLLINDRVDVALAAGVEGVHIGQDDIGKPSLSHYMSTSRQFKA
jgi:thiamine-phosphate diphosphorylase/hydroxyethylthiazole kinase